MPRWRRWAAKSKPAPGVSRSCAKAAADRELAPHLDAARQPRPARNSQQKPDAAKRSPQATSASAERAERGRPRRRRRDRRAARARGRRESRPAGASRDRSRASPIAAPAKHEGSGDRRRARACGGRARQRDRRRRCGRRVSARARAAERKSGAPRSAHGDVERPLSGRSRLQRVAKRRQALLADALHLRQLLEGPEAAVGVAVLDDALGERRTESVDLVELLRRRGREVDLRARRSAPVAAADPPGAAFPAAPFTGTTICWPSWSGAARFTSVRSARRVGPAGPVERGRHAGARRADAAGPASSPPPPRERRDRSGSVPSVRSRCGAPPSIAHRGCRLAAAAEQPHQREHGDCGGHDPDHDG